jgi:hypothetical protein
VPESLIGRRVNPEIKEAEIQSLFGKHLKDFEEGLRFVSSYLGG